MLAVVEEIARQDASAAWVTMIGATSAITSAYLEPAVARTIFGDGPGVIVAGIVAPRGTAVRDSDGYTLNGHWPFGSGCQHSDWIALAMVAPDANGGGRTPDARFFLVPMTEVQIIDTWDVSGLRATGSHDIVVEDVHVPATHAYSLISGRPLESGPLYGFSILPLLSVAVASVALGTARGALDDLRALVETKVPTGRRRTTNQWNVAQVDYARAEAALRSGRAFLLDAITDVWDTLERGDVPSTAQRAMVRLAATQAVNSAVVAVDIAYTHGGGTAIYSKHPLQRRFRDIHTITQHVMVGPSSLEAAGRALLGLDVPPGFL
jgi:alkylation response protein AidB-like acyl-CoA dehydrogenase